MRFLYDTASISVQVLKQQTARRVRQGDFISPTLFTNATEDMFEILNWNGRGIKVNAEYIYHLLFVVDIVRMVETT